MKDQRVYVDDILDRIARIEDFTQGGREAFNQSVLIQDAVIRCFEVIGEVVKRLSPELTDSYPEIPWRRIAGFRDVLIHDYEVVDLDEVWGVVEQHLQPLKQAVEAIRQKLETQGKS